MEPKPAELTIVIDDGHGTTTTWQLTCDPVGGDHPDPSRACAVLQTVGARYLPEVPEDLRCTQIYGGPETAHISGTWGSTVVDANLSRTDGCQIARWNGLVGLIPSGGM